MAASSVHAEVIELVAEERGLAVAKVQLSSRLWHDLGMYGDDAVEFFEKFQNRYGVDLTALHQNWDCHFGPEGFGSLMLLPVMVLLLLLPVPLLPLGISPILVWTLELVALLLWFWPLRQWPLKDKSIPVTVQDLVSAAETKRWPMTYEERD
jgi:hypothetical protein